MRRFQLVRWHDRRRARHDLRGIALEAEQRVGGRSGECLDVLERRRQAREQLDRGGHRGAVPAEIGRPHCPPIAREPKLARHVQAGLDSLHERGDGVGPRPAERRVAFMNPIQKPFEAPDVDQPRTLVRKTEHSFRQRLVPAIEVELRINLRSCRRARGACPLLRQIGSIVIEVCQRDGEQRHPVRRGVAQHRRRQGLFDCLARRQRRCQRLHDRRQVDER